MGFSFSYGTSPLEIIKKTHKEHICHVCRETIKSGETAFKAGFSSTYYHKGHEKIRGKAAINKFRSKQVQK